MSSASRLPHPALRPFVGLVWSSEAGGLSVQAALRELMLPDGTMHLAFRVDGSPVRIAEHPGSGKGRTVGASLVGGMRTVPYVKEVSAPAASVGLVLRPGAAELLSGAPAVALAGRHSAIEDIWPAADLAELQDRLATGPAAGRLQVLEDFLLRRLSRMRPADALIGNAVGGIAAGARVADVVADSGFSHRHFVRRYEQAVGLAPRLHGRLLRFGHALSLLHATPGRGLAGLAAEAGYADQAHLSREFREFSGLTPAAYRRIRPGHARHVPWPFR